MLGVFFSVHFEIIDKLQRRRRQKVNVNRIGKKLEFSEWFMTMKHEKVKNSKVENVASVFNLVVYSCVESAQFVWNNIAYSKFSQAFTLLLFFAPPSTL